MRRYYKIGGKWSSYVPSSNPNPLSVVEPINRDYKAIGEWSASFGVQVLSYPTVICFGVK